jgi:hypothetical protein
MSATAGCPRFFEAEAMRDGRLAGAERASFGRHIAMCPVCAREVRALATLAEELRAGSRRDKADELRIRRERTRLLAAFDRVLVTTERRRPPRRFLAVGAAAVALLVCLLVLWRVRAVPPAAPVSTA